MENFFVFIDLGSYVLSIIFLVLALLIKQKIMLPQNNILLLIGIFLFLHTGSHIPSYFPETFPQLGEFTEHLISDVTLFLTAITLLYYGITTYQTIIKSLPK